MTVKNCYLLLLISKILDKTTGIKYFLKIDIKDTYYQIRIKEGDKQKTIFYIYYSYFKYYILLFSLTNTLATFQAYINQALIGLVNIIYIIYLDNILIYLEDKVDYTKAIYKVFKYL